KVPPVMRTAAKPGEAFTPSSNAPLASVVPLASTAPSAPVGRSAKTVTAAPASGPLTATPAASALAPPPPPLLSPPQPPRPASATTHARPPILMLPLDPGRRRIAAAPRLHSTADARAPAEAAERSRNPAYVRRIAQRARGARYARARGDWMGASESD